jgi:hypothetical protein
MSLLVIILEMSLKDWKHFFKKFLLDVCYGIFSLYYFNLFHLNVLLRRSFFLFTLRLLITCNIKVITWESKSLLINLLFNVGCLSGSKDLCKEI